MALESRKGGSLNFHKYTVSGQDSQSVNYYLSIDAPVNILGPS